MTGAKYYAVISDMDGKRQVRIVTQNEVEEMHQARECQYTTFSMNDRTKFLQFASNQGLYDEAEALASSNEEASIADCPFCCCDMETIGWYFAYSRRRSAVMCPSCGARGPYSDSEDDAKAQWNKRLTEKNIKVGGYAACPTDEAYADWNRKKGK